MKKVLLSNIHKYFIVDDEDYERTIIYTWWIAGDRPLIRTSMYGKEINIGRFILGPSELPIVDHKDRNIFNNQKSNLRNATFSQNSANRFNSNNTSGYKGVTWEKACSRWRATIKFKNRKVTHLGTFHNKIDAAKAYNKAALEYYGEFAYLNVLPESEVPVE